MPALTHACIPHFPRARAHVVRWDGMDLLPSSGFPLCALPVRMRYHLQRALCKGHCKQPSIRHIGRGQWGPAGRADGQLALLCRRTDRCVLPTTADRPRPCLLLPLPAACQASDTHAYRAGWAVKRMGAQGTLHAVCSCVQWVLGDGGPIVHGPDAGSVTPRGGRTLIGAGKGKSPTGGKNEVRRERERARVLLELDERSDG